MAVKINDIAYHLPPGRLTKSDLKELNPDWDIDKIEERTGIACRRIVASGQTALDMGVYACEELITQNPELGNKINGIIFCSTTPDLISPQNSYLVHKKLNLPDHVFCLDIGMACSGFVYALAVAEGLLKTGIATDIVIINSDVMSEHVHDHDRSCKCLFSDGASAAWLAVSDTDKGIIDMAFGAQGKSVGAAYVPKTIIDPELPSVKSHMVMDGKKLLTLAGSKIPRQIKGLLNKNRLTLNDVDLFVFHQGSKLVIDALKRLLRLQDEKVFRNYSCIGNTSSASIPIALKDALECRKIKAGSLVVLSGFGLGFSWGSVILKI